MAGIVIDASVVASWLLPDETNQSALDIYNRLSSEPAHVPALWDYEIRNILVVNERRGRITTQAVDAALEWLIDLNILRYTLADWDAAVRLSRQFALTAYLELSIRVDLPLATFDKALAAAAARNDKLAHHTPLKP
ncbi:type II toxin-antitoxin system VapC family toxin [Neorhizobium galegae]|uniref:type II toxin-antitoxin system VapC family toxin n=1 Tax=Neorhizobium galegae TaxID=399 RepID=UPI001F2D7F5B|nr:type II toxin-antitoxin system VapC family toxin [Neorhizobium galegae]UIK06870.1 type II toxin-antitoxin system VapC family toxin [Neorhizobium galegae]